MKYVLDATILIGLERNNRNIVREIGRFIRADNVFYTTTLNLAEFYYGCVAKKEEAKKKAEQFISRFRVLTLTGQSARIYAELAYKHDKAGTKPGDFDLLTAAIAIDNDATVLTTDTDFNKIAELKKEILSQT